MRVEKISSYNRVNFAARTNNEQKKNNRFENAISDSRKSLPHATLFHIITKRDEEYIEKLTRSKAPDDILELYGPTHEDTKRLRSLITFTLPMAADKKMSAQHTAQVTAELEEKIKLGKENGFEDTADETGAMLSFGEINEKTGLPNTLTVTDPEAKDGKLVYRLIDGTKAYSITRTSDGTDYEVNVVNNKAIRQFSREKETGKTKEFIPCRDGFYFFEGTTDKNGNATDIDTELRYYESDEYRMSWEPKSSCVSKLQDGTPYRFTHLITMRDVKMAPMQ